jgi:hypothetical protein
MSKTAVPQVVLTILIGVLPAWSVVSGQTPERSRTQGIKETNQFLKAGQATSKAVSDGKLQMQNTLQAYHALVTQSSKDMKGDYKKLMKAMDVMNEKVADARAKVDAMQKSGDTYFRGRAETLKGIQDADLQRQAQDRLTQNKKDFSAVEDALREGGRALEPFRKQLADQITYLGSDLNASATASLKPQAEKLNAQATEVFGKVDEATAKANNYFQSLRPES